MNSEDPLIEFCTKQSVLGLGLFLRQPDVSFSNLLSKGWTSKMGKQIIEAYQDGSEIYGCGQLRKPVMVFRVKDTGYYVLGKTKDLDAVISGGYAKRHIFMSGSGDDDNCSFVIMPFSFLLDFVYEKKRI